MSDILDICNTFAARPKQWPEQCTPKDSIAWFLVGQILCQSYLGMMEGLLVTMVLASWHSPVFSMRLS